MCTVCGCGPSAAAGPGDAPGVHAHDHHHGDADHAHDHPHDHDHHHRHHDHHAGHAHPPSADRRPLRAADGGRRLIAVERDILADNDSRAAANRAFFRARGIAAVNLMSAPGSGKTTLLARTIGELSGTGPIGVIEGDQETSFDADRIRATGAPCVQINTGKGCHLDARMVADALPVLAPPPGGLVFIENVGNLVCPAAFDLGEDARVVLLSVTEGDDKPLKYANMFAGAQLMLLTKVDLLPYVPFDVGRCTGFARRVNPQIGVIGVSATTGVGLADWYGWLDRRRMHGRLRPPAATVG